MQTIKALRVLLAAATMVALAPTVTHADWVSTIAADAPLHWYQFEETTGTTAADSGSAGLTGTYTNGVVLDQPGLVGRAIGLDGVDDHVSLDGADLAGDWTAELIVSASGTTPSQGYMGSSVAALKADQWNQTGQMGYTAFGVIDVTLNAPTPAELSHVVYVKTASGVDLYVNGALADTGTTLIDLPLDVVGAGRINPDDSVIDPLGGLIDEVVIYDRALSAGDVETHFAAIPEPSTFVLAALALLGLGVWSRRKSSRV